MALFGEDSILMGAAGAGGPEAFRYFLLDVTVSNSGVIMFVNDLRYRSGGTYYPTVNMTSDSAPSPLVASASSDDANNVASFAFNANTHNGWAPDRPGVGWNKLDLGSGNGIVLDEVRILPDPADGARSPNTFTVEGSNTGAFSGEETVLITRSGITFSAGTPQTFTVD